MKWPIEIQINELPTKIVVFNHYIRLPEGSYKITIHNRIVCQWAIAILNYWRVSMFPELVEEHDQERQSRHINPVTSFTNHLILPAKIEVQPNINGLV